MSVILIVNDEDDFRRCAAESFRQASHAVEECSNGADAVELLNNHVFDIDITDLTMPGKNGVEVLKEATRRNPGVIGVIVPEFDSNVRNLKFENSHVD